MIKKLLATAVFLFCSSVSWAVVSCTLYVDDDGSNTSPYETWAKAATTLSTAISAWTTSDVICMRNTHSQTQGGTLTLDATGDTADIPVPIYSVSCSTCDGTDDTYTPGASTQVAVTSGGSDILFQGHFNVMGLRFSAEDNIELGDFPGFGFQGKDNYFLMTSASARMQLSTLGDRPTQLYGGTIEFSHATGGDIYSQNQAIAELYGVTITGNALSTGLFAFPSRPTYFKCVGCDLSAFGSDTLVDFDDNGGSGYAHFIGCKLPSTVTITTGTMGPHQQVFVSGSDADGASDGQSFRQELYTNWGDVTTDTGVYYDDGFVFTEDSANASLKFEPNSLISPPEPLCSWPTYEWIDATGSLTFSTELIENYTSALTQEDVWQELFYLGTTNSAYWSFDSGEDTLGATALTAGDAGAADWTGEPASSRFHKLQTTVTINKAGVYMIRWCVGTFESGKVVHVDPAPTIN